MEQHQPQSLSERDAGLSAETRPSSFAAIRAVLPTSARDGGGDTAPLCVRNASGAYSFVATTTYPSASGSNVLFSTRSPTLCNSDSSSPY